MRSLSRDRDTAVHCCLLFCDPHKHELGMTQAFAERMANVTQNITVYRRSLHTHSSNILLRGQSLEVKWLVAKCCIHFQGLDTVLNLSDC